MTRIQLRAMIRVFLLRLTSAALFVITFWNIWIFDRNAADLPPRNASEVVTLELRYEPIREILAATGFQNGNIAFITNRDLKSQTNTGDDDKRWGQAQFMLIPWILLRGSRSVSGYEAKTGTLFVIGDFWDGRPAVLPANLLKVYESEDGLMLFRRKPTG